MYYYGLQPVAHEILVRRKITPKEVWQLKGQPLQDADYQCNPKHGILVNVKCKNAKNSFYKCECINVVNHPALQPRMSLAVLLLSLRKLEHILLIIVARINGGFRVAMCLPVLHFL